MIVQRAKRATSLSRECSQSSLLTPSRTRISHGRPQGHRQAALPLTKSAKMESARGQAASEWFGYGRWEAPYWFVGMEPGGTEQASSYESWLRLGGGELIDCKQHHLDTNFTRWHGEDQRGTQPTWRRLIQALLGYEGRSATLEDVLQVQHDGWGASNGEMALVEVCALHAPRTAATSDRTSYRNERIATLRERLATYRPTFALFYGLTYRQQYEKVAGGAFDEDEFRWSADTLCVLTPHPTSHLHGKPTPWAKGEWWIALGQRMREARDAHRT
jgi:hypothetical protein